MFLPDMLYKYKPYLIVLAGGMAMLATSHPLGIVGGVLLIMAGAIIYRMRCEG